ncbi:MAG: hypothetical protein JOS17DRAFT_547496 [Linnemannia elongata]|nr:MAG: hypothetical protein JOS17DRAFT_547496 [Linnemannia elongata]
MYQPWMIAYNMPLGPLILSFFSFYRQHVRYVCILIEGEPILEGLEDDHGPMCVVIACTSIVKLATGKTGEQASLGVCQAGRQARSNKLGSKTSNKQTHLYMPLEAPSSLLFMFLPPILFLALFLFSLLSLPFFFLFTSSLSSIPASPSVFPCSSPLPLITLSLYSHRPSYFNLYSEIFTHPSPPFTTLLSQISRLPQLTLFLSQITLPLAHPE